jgi:hypothetical protein
MDLQSIINEAAQSRDWLMLAAASLALIVPVVLKALGKSVPIVDQLLGLLLKVVSAFRKPPQAPPPADGKAGIAAVVPIKDEKKE